MGNSRYREARELFITADAGGSNGRSPEPSTRLLSPVPDNSS